MKNRLLFLFFYGVAVQMAVGQQSDGLSATSAWVSQKKAPLVAPVVAWQVPLPAQATANTAAYRITFCVQTAGSLTQLQIIHNDREFNGLQRGYKLSTCGLQLSEELTLVAGTNHVRVVATNAAGSTTSETRRILYQPETAALHPLVQKRLALVVANGTYPKYPLKNPVNDGRAVKTHLSTLGFAVTLKENLPLREWKKAVDEFMTALGTNDVALVYYAGHGLMINGENYVQPVDADPSAETDVEFECYPLRRLIARMEQTNPKGANLVFWDACRNNPYRSWRRSFGDPVFAPVQPAVGTLIVYATEPGKPAYDGDAQNSLFTSELIQHIAEPNMDLFDLVDRIDRGLEARGVKQPPYIEGRLRGKFFFNPAP